MRIYCLVGKSCVGKDTLFNSILKSKKFNMHPIIPYTTRPIRKNETDGVQYHFVTQKQMEDMEAQGKVIEKRVYHTIHGDWAYFTADEGDHVIGDRVIITTISAIDKLAQWYGKEKIILIHLTVDDKLRLERAIRRENRQKKPNYSEVCRRYLADQADYSQENFEKYHPVFEINTGRPLKECTKQFYDIVRFENQK